MSIIPRLNPRKSNFAAIPSVYLLSSESWRTLYSFLMSANDAALTACVAAFEVVILVT